MDPPCTGCSTSGMCWNAVNRTLCPVCAGLSVFIRFGPESVSSSLTGCCCQPGPLQRQDFPLTDSWKCLITEATRAVCFVKCLLKILQRDPQMDSSLRQITSANLSRHPGKYEFSGTCLRGRNFNPKLSVSPSRTNLLLNRFIPPVEEGSDEWCCVNGVLNQKTLFYQCDGGFLTATFVL